MMKTNTNNRPQHVRLMLLEQMPAQVRHLVASSTALDLLHQAMLMVSYGRITMTIKMASKVVV